MRGRHLSIWIEGLGSFSAEVLFQLEVHLIAAGLELLPGQERARTPVLVGAPVKVVELVSIVPNFAL